MERHRTVFIEYETDNELMECYEHLSIDRTQRIEIEGVEYGVHSIRLVIYYGRIPGQEVEFTQYVYLNRMPSS